MAMFERVTVRGHTAGARRVGGLLVASFLAACAACGSLRSGASIDDVATPPRLLNGDQVVAAIEREYPPELRAQGIGGVVRLRLLVGTDGVPVQVAILDSSGNAELDQAARRVAPVLRFGPATDRDGNPVRVWASFPIAFR
jgi:TonB family protein